MSTRNSRNSPYRCAVVGTGGIADAHAGALAELGDQARLVAAVDVDEGRVKAFAARWDVPRTSTDLAEVLDAGDIDMVHICTPPQSHLPIAAQCLAADVNALIEKPPALSLAQFDTLIAAEAASKASAAVVFQHRFGSAATRLRSLAGDGALGRPLVATCDTTWYRDDSYFAVPWRGEWDIEGGGPTMGHGIHQTDLLLSVLGPWAEVTAMAGRLSRPTSTEDVSCAVVRFENGALATVVNSVVSPRESSMLRFDWEYATVELRHLYGYGDDDWELTPAPGHESVGPAWAAGAAGIRSGHSAQLRHVFDALDAATPPPVPLAEARDTLELAAAVYASAFTRVPVRRGEIVDGNPFYARMDGPGAPWATTTDNERRPRPLHPGQKSGVPRRNSQ